MATVYIETSVPSAYVSTRTDPSSLHRRNATHEWWGSQRRHYDLFTSDAVIIELREGDWPGQAEAIGLVQGIQKLLVDDEITAIAERYIRERLVPEDLFGDAMHLAIACTHELDFLLTWNIRHLANVNKVRHLTVINRRLGLLTPLIVTPEMLWMD
jgi:hypothetical protein